MNRRFFIKAVSITALAPKNLLDKKDLEPKVPEGMVAFPAREFRWDVCSRPYLPYWETPAIFSTYEDRGILEQTVLGAPKMMKDKK